MTSREPASIRLSGSLPRAVMLVLESNLTTTLYVSSETEITGDDRNVHIFAHFTKSDGRAFTCEQDSVLSEGIVDSDLWVYPLQLTFVESKVDDAGGKPAAQRESRAARIVHSDGDGSLALTSASLSLVVELQTYQTIDRALFLEGEVKTFLPNQFISASPAGFNRVVDVKGGPGSDTPSVPRHIVVYYYRRVNLGTPAIRPTQVRIQFSDRSLVIPRGFISVFSTSEYTDVEGRVYRVRGLSIALPRLREDRLAILPFGEDGSLQFQATGIDVVTELTFNGTIDFVAADVEDAAAE
ncbi:MAG: hypothetical protein SFX72_16615 [Isosphaeraceae bacterium]|nr:hypothetical protein [Isosphaeraceae bacterium]